MKNLNVLAAWMGFVCSAVAPAFAQPRIDGVVDSASYKANISFGGLGTVFGAGLASGIYSATTVPLPEVLSGTEVFLCRAQDDNCIRQKLIYVSPGQINFLVEDYPGQSQDGQRIAVRVNGVPDTEWNAATPQNTWTFIEQITPEIFLAGNDCWFDPNKGDASPCGLRWDTPQPTGLPGFSVPLRAVVTDTAYRIVESKNPARVGSSYTIWLTGLGAPSQLSTTKTHVVLQVPSYGLTTAMNNGKTYFDSYNPTVRYIGPSSFSGLYQINFDLTEDALSCCWNGAPKWPCGTRKWDVQLAAAYFYLTNSSGPSGPVMNYPALLSLPILVQDGDRTDCH